MTTLLYQVQLVMYIARLQVQEKASCEHCGNPCVLQHWATEDKDMPDPHGGLEGIEEMPYWQMCLGAREIQRYPPPPPPPPFACLQYTKSTCTRWESSVSYDLNIHTDKSRVFDSLTLVAESSGLLMDCAGPPRYLTSPVSHRHIPKWEDWQTVRMVEGVVHLF